MNILFADDHELVRDIICGFLEREDTFSVSVASDFAEASGKISSQGPFDLVLLDYTMPGMNGLTGLVEALDLNRGRPVAILSGTATRSVAEKALAAGAAGFLPKTLAAKSLVNAVRFIAAGERYVPLQFMTDSEQTPLKQLESKLTKREFEVLGGLIEGRSNKEIARDLDLQEVTIKLHVKTLCRKLGARNRTNAAMIAKEAGLF
jgi:DNA-binding NarL/FixJ family response regulator